MSFQIYNVSCFYRHSVTPALAADAPMDHVTVLIFIYESVIGLATSDSDCFQHYTVIPYNAVILKVLFNKEDRK